MESVWTATTEMPRFQSLQRDIKTDVLVIGGGIAGILCAYFLHKNGVDCTLVEAKRLCSGMTGNTTAKITSQHSLLYHKLIREFGTEKAAMYLKANEQAKEQYRALAKTIDCDFETKDNYVYSLLHPGKIEKELAALQKIGFPAALAENLPLPFPVAGAVCFPNQAQFSPLKLLSALVGELNVYENTPVRELLGLTAVTDGGKIRAQKIVMATHFPILNKHGAYFMKMYQHRSYVLALAGAQKVDGMYVDEASKGMSFRNYGDLLLVGGGGHRTGKKGGSFQELERFSDTHYPDAVPRYRWAAQDCITLDGVPYIGEYARGTRGLYVTTGYNKWGMTTAMVSAALLTDLILGKQNEFAEVFLPSRTVLRPTLAVNAFESTLSLLTPTSKRCPHLGCALKWNKAEHSWDCPCHGSRFTAQGELLDNPATGNLKHCPKK